MTSAVSEGKQRRPSASGKIGELESADPLRAIERSRGIGEFERAFLEAVPRLVDVDAYGIAWLDSDQHTASVRTRNVPRGLVEQYELLGRPNDSLFGYMARRDEPVHDRVLFDQRQWIREPVARFLSDWGFGRCMQAPVIVDGDLRATLHFLRAPGARPFSKRDLHAAALLNRRVGHQLSLIFAEREASRARRLCASLLEHMPFPAVVTTAAGSLVHRNHAADLMLVTFRCEAALWPEYAAAVAQNAGSVAATGREGGPTHAARHDCDDPGYTVRTHAIEGGELLLSLFQPAGSEQDGWSALSPREQVIANLVAQGYTNDRIASALTLSVNTVKEYLKRMNRKLGTSNRAEVAARAQQHHNGSVRAGRLGDLRRPL